MTDTPIDTDDLPLLTEDEILARFYRLNTTLGITKTHFGYVSCGTPGIIKRIEMGKKLHEKTRRQLTAIIHRIEKEHSSPLSDGVMPNK